jgi:hypothetical protein
MTDDDGPTVTATVTIYNRQTHIDRHGWPNRRVHLADVIRGNGPREGDLMGWAALVFGEDGGVSFQIRSDRSDAEADYRAAVDDN